MCWSSVECRCGYEYDYEVAGLLAVLQPVLLLPVLAILWLENLYVGVCRCQSLMSVDDHWRQ